MINGILFPYNRNITNSTNQNNNETNNNVNNTINNLTTLDNYHQKESLIMNSIIYNNTINTNLTNLDSLIDKVENKTQYLIHFNKDVIQSNYKDLYLSIQVINGMNSITANNTQNDMINELLKSNKAVMITDFIINPKMIGKNINPMYNKEVNYNNS